MPENRVYSVVQMFGALTVIFALVLASGCAGPAHLDLVSKDGTTDEEMIRDAPVIIIGKVTHQRAIGPIRNSCRLVRVVTSVENTIKGQVPSNTVTFYFYSPWLGASGDWNSLQNDKRYIFFLIWQNGVLRAIRDVPRSNIRVYSGKHQTLPVTADDHLPERIAMVLFMPGEELDPDEFSVGLLHATSHGWLYLGRWQTAVLLNGLLRNEHRAVRIGACEELTLGYNGIDGCWNSIDFGDGSLLRSRYGVIPPQISRGRQRQWIKETRDSEAWWNMAAKRYSREELIGELRLLTLVDNADIRQRFCALLKQKYPDEKCARD